MKRIYTGLFVLSCFFSVSIADVLAKDVAVKITRHMGAGISTEGANIIIVPATSYDDFQLNIRQTFGATALGHLVVGGKPINKNNWDDRKQYILNNNATITGNL